MPAKSKMTAYLDYSTTAITFDDNVNEFMKLFHAKEFANWETIYDTKKKWDTRRGNLKKNIKKSIEGKCSPTALAYQMFLTYIKNTIKCDTDDILKAIATKHNGEAIDYNKHYESNNDMINNYIDIEHKKLYKDNEKKIKLLEEHYKTYETMIKDIDRNGYYEECLEKLKEKNIYIDKVINDTTPQERADDRPHLEKLFSILNKKHPRTQGKLEEAWGGEVPVKIELLYDDYMKKLVKLAWRPNGIKREDYINFKFDISLLGVKNKDYIYNMSRFYKDDIQNEILDQFCVKYHYIKETFSGEDLDNGLYLWDFEGDSVYNKVFNEKHIRPATEEDIKNANS